MGGYGGALPPQESPLPVPCPPGGVWGLRPPGISVTRALPPQVDVQTVKNLKMSSKGRTDLKILPSKAKNLEELEFDVRKNLAPPKSIKNDDKLSSEIVKNSDLLFHLFDVFGTAKGRSRLKF